MFETPVPARTRHTLLLVCVGGLTVAAWISLSLSGGWLLHHHPSSQGSASAPPLTLFVSGWIVMTVAMMLPTTLPLLTTFHTIAAKHRSPPMLLTLAVVGYIVGWAIFGVLVYLGYCSLHWFGTAFVPSEWREYAKPLLLVGAGAFQFSSLKYQCLDKCRSPFTVIAEHWQGRREHWQAFRLGLDHGVFCVGCCWALMLLMFLVGSGHLWWMFALAVVMAIEKNHPFGRRFSKPVGVVLITAGIALFSVDALRQ